VRVVRSANYAATGDGRENDYTVEKPKLLKRAQASEVEGDRTRAAARQGQADLWSSRLAHEDGVNTKANAA